jgi:hypothetical protein
MFDTLISDRIVTMTFQPAREIGDWLARTGLTVTVQNDGAVVIHNPYLNLTTAISDSLDPVSRAVTIAFALLGVAWPQICPTLLTQVNREWRRQQQTIHKPADSTEQKGGREK